MAQLWKGQDTTAPSFAECAERLARAAAAQRGFAPAAFPGTDDPDAAVAAAAAAASAEAGCELARLANVQVGLTSSALERCRGGAPGARRASPHQSARRPRRASPQQSERRLSPRFTTTE